MLRIASGHSVDYYLDAVATGGQRDVGAAPPHVQRQVVDGDGEVALRELRAEHAVGGVDDEVSDRDVGAAGGREIGRAHV